ncbi:ssDNA binding protein-like protein Ssb3 [Dothidotthia symphoricarpi CBS 119687]|uniref:SsDNA binding protein-like protein Ssb3 n=1 Tax=Dothidotthia symphoricarpi CBS 119687 TaxID=1392245 RepID=A0A6A6A7A1_9PLEO|nr:ssDNA binding protein-like protein Ssb3 [Dothidotthia symphoricarpi CBS 119687]KAF2126944.1 ssDNA binding protein-like protein Ssb3 [Dothidotthia symphoricarpi CBS 119687]
MDHPQTPRVLATHLANFQHRIVRVLGTVVQLRGETAVIDAGGQIDVILNRDAHLALNHAVEIIGKVDGNLHVKVQAATDFGTNIDFTAANAVVDATHRHKEIFYDGE